MVDQSSTHTHLVLAKPLCPLNGVYTTKVWRLRCSEIHWVPQHIHRLWISSSLLASDWWLFIRLVFDEEKPRAEKQRTTVEVKVLARPPQTDHGAATRSVYLTHARGEFANASPLEMGHDFCWQIMNCGVCQHLAEQRRVHKSGSKQKCLTKILEFSEGLTKDV